MCTLCSAAPAREVHSRHQSPLRRAVGFALFSNESRRRLASKCRSFSRKTLVIQLLYGGKVFSSEVVIQLLQLRSQSLYSYKTGEKCYVLTQKACLYFDAGSNFYKIRHQNLTHLSDTNLSCSICYLFYLRPWSSFGINIK